MWRSSKYQKPSWWFQHGFEQKNPCGDHVLREAPSRNQILMPSLIEWGSCVGYKVKEFLDGSLCWISWIAYVEERTHTDTDRPRERERGLGGRHRCAHAVTEDRWCWSMLYLCWVFWHSPASVLQLSTGPTRLLMSLSVGTYTVWITPHPWNSRIFFFSPHDHPIQLFLSFCSRLAMCVGSNFMSSTTLDVCL